MYTIKYINIDNTKESDGFLMSPISYRVSVNFNPHDKKITIKRRYFRVGFIDGEEWDKPFYDIDLSWKSVLSVSVGSIMTRKIDDPEYLRQIEKKMIKGFYERCFKSVDNIEKELKKTTKLLNNQKDNYKQIILSLGKIFRKEKLEKIIDNLEDDRKNQKV